MGRIRVPVLLYPAYCWVPIRGECGFIEGKDTALTNFEPSPRRKSNEVGIAIQLLLKASPEFLLNGIEYVFASCIEIDSDNCGSLTPETFHHYFIK